MIMLDYRVGGWVKKWQNIDYVIFERSLILWRGRRIMELENLDEVIYG